MDLNPLSYAPVQLPSQNQNFDFEDHRKEREPSLSDIPREGIHLLAMNFIPFWSTGRHLFGDKKKEPLEWKVAFSDGLFAVTTLRAGLFLFSGVLAARGGRPVRAMNLLLGKLEQNIAPFRDLLVPLMFGVPALFNISKQIRDEKPSSHTAWMELGFVLLSLRSNHYRVRSIDREMTYLIHQEQAHPDFLRRCRTEAMGPLRRPIPKIVPISERLDPRNVDFRNGVPSHDSYWYSLRGIFTVVSDARRVTCPGIHGNKGSTERDFQNWGVTYLQSQQAQFRAYGFEEHAVPVLMQGAPALFASTHKTCWPDFAALWAANPRALIEADRYNFHDAWYAWALGFSRAARRIDLPLIDRGKRSWFAQQVDRLRGRNGSSTGVTDSMRRYQASVTETLASGRPIVKFVNDGRLPISWGKNGEILEAGIFGQIPEPSHPIEFMKHGVAHVASHAARTLGKQVAIVPTYLETGRIMPKNLGFWPKLHAMFPFFQKNRPNETVTIRYGAPIWVQPGDRSKAIVRKLEEALITLSGQIPARQEWLRQSLRLSEAAQARLENVSRSGWIALDRALTRKPGDPLRGEALSRFQRLLENDIAVERNQGFDALLLEVTRRLSA